MIGGDACRKGQYALAGGKVGDLVQSDVDILRFYGKEDDVAVFDDLALRGGDVHAVFFIFLEFIGKFIEQGDIFGEENVCPLDGCDYGACDMAHADYTEAFLGSHFNGSFQSTLVLRHSMEYDTKKKLQSKPFGAIVSMCTFGDKGIRRGHLSSCFA